MKKDNEKPNNEKSVDSPAMSSENLPDSETALKINDSATEWIKSLVKLYRDTQKEDLDYLDAHPEIQEIITLLLDELQKSKPPNIHRFAALYFQHNQHKIKLKTLK